MDALDLRILAALMDDARRPYSEVARELGVSQPTVTERMKRMESRGVVQGATLKVDYAKLGFPLVGMVRIVSDTRDQYKLEAIAQDLPQVVEMHRITGEDCLIARVVARSMEEMAALIEQLCQFGSSNTSVVLSTPIPLRSPIQALLPGGDGRRGKASAKPQKRSS